MVSIDEQPQYIRNAALFVIFENSPTGTGARLKKTCKAPFSSETKKRGKKE